MKPAELTLYRDLLGDIRQRVRRAQQRAVLSVNAEMLLMYWDIGKLIAMRQAQKGWGAGVIPRLAADLKNELPEEKGFSLRNLKLMVQFYNAYPGALTIGQPPVAQLPNDASTGEIGQRPVAHSSSKIDTESAVSSAPNVLRQTVVRLSWAHNVILMQKVKDLPTRLWYADQALAQGWSRDTMRSHIEKRAHERQGGAITNFTQTLPDAHAALAQGLLKDPYLFDFLTMDEPFHERELETGLLRHLEKFLLELGRGFAFVGRQYRLEVSDREFFLDLLFYHLQLRCFIVVELKKGDFKPEYAGKMNFYCSAVDDLLRHPQDTATIGLILCQTKDRVLAEYSLRDIHKPIGLADYELTRALPTALASSLPSIEDIEAELADEIDAEGAR
jgi:predicted nuclease of restriction endonuclease-like (RecB) superfamily